MDQQAPQEQIPRKLPIDGQRVVEYAAEKEDMDGEGSPHCQGRWPLRPARQEDPADQEHIFDPYFTSKPDGTGLGLAIVHKIIDAHHGTIKVKSKPGLGTTITLILPDAEEEQDHGQA